MLENSVAEELNSHYKNVFLQGNCFAAVSSCKKWTDFFTKAITKKINQSYEP